MKDTIWEITYSVDHHYRTNDNYGAIQSDGYNVVTGNDLDDAIKNLIDSLTYDNQITGIIETASRINDKSDYYELDIISIREIIIKNIEDEESVFKNHQFVSIIDRCKKEHSDSIKKMEEQEVIRLEKKERKMYETLKKKYG